MNKKALAVIGGIAGAVGAGYLISHVIAESKTYTVMITSNPIRTAILVDGEKLVATPATISLSKGIHTLKAIDKSPDTFVTYQIDKWLVNGKPAAYDTTQLTLNITAPTRIRVDYMLANYGTTPILAIPQ